MAHKEGDLVVSIGRLPWDPIQESELFLDKCILDMPSSAAAPLKEQELDLMERASSVHVRFLSLCCGAPFCCCLGAVWDSHVP
jgi:hypothetical protein